ncbi:MAG TPA: hypothetical protein VNT76_24235 [Candidatus Binatus sp.]|nr:hypothetical protein [Candidatus Binatus sp.]
MKLHAQLTTVCALDERRREQMFALMDQYYAGMKREVFEVDLREKRWVIQLIDAQTQALRGFSTQMLLERQIDGKPARALFSGDTIVDRGCWGQSLLAQAWGHLALSLIDAHPNEFLYWFLISKGYKTYRFLPVFFREFYPRFDRPTPSWAARIIDAFAREKFPGSYDSSGGVIRAAAASGRLRQGVAQVTVERLSDPHVRFFVERNPNHALGEELCCIAPLTRENFTAAAKRPLRCEGPNWSVVS